MLAIELYEAGVIDDGDLDGLRLEWGNTEAILEVMDAIVHKRGFGEILALGPGKMLSAIGRGAEAYAVDHKNGLVSRFELSACGVEVLRAVYCKTQRLVRL